MARESLATDLIDKHCPTCFVHYAAPKALFDKKNETGERWFCPNGHHVVYTQSKLQKAEAERDALKLERDRLKQNESYLTWRAESFKKNGIAMKGQMTKLRKRVANGVCPCCNRSFANLHRHMAGQHPGYTAEALPEPEKDRAYGH